MATAGKVERSTIPFAVGNRMRVGSLLLVKTEIGFCHANMDADDIVPCDRDAILAEYGDPEVRVRYCRGSRLGGYRG